MNFHRCDSSAKVDIILKFSATDSISAIAAAIIPKSLSHLELITGVQVFKPCGIDTRQEEIMPEHTSTRRQFLFVTTSGIVTATLQGCGTVLYPERMGQRRGSFDDVDWTVAGLNGIGLVFFFVPGAIAFAIDFYNGTLFYPSNSYADASGNVSGELKQVSLAEQNPSLETVEHAVAEETGHRVKLEPGTFISKRMKSIKEFWLTKRQVSEST